MAFIGKRRKSQSMFLSRFFEFAVIGYEAARISVCKGKGRLIRDRTPAQE